MNEDSIGNKSIKWYVIVLLFLGVLALYLVSWALIDRYIENPQEQGVFGDKFGAINALFSGLAFAGLIITLILQKTELGLQREELEQTREELKNQRLEFETQNETLKYQRFENLFYNMLNLQQEIVAGLRYEYEEEEIERLDSTPFPNKRKVIRVVSGRDVFRYAFEGAEIMLSDRDQFSRRIIVKGYREYLNVKGISEYDKTWIPTLFDHYFRHLYKIIQYVDVQGFPFNEAYRYVALLRGTLSRYELIWLYYNALNPVYHKFQELIEKYSLLKNMREDLLTRCKEVAMYYEGLGLTIQDVKDAAFSARDFEFYLTDDKKNAEKYFVTAFWKEEEKEQGLGWLKRWRLFIDDATKKVVKEV